MGMQLNFKLLIVFLFQVFLFTPSMAQPDYFTEAVNYSLKKNLPSGSSWEAKIPTFLLEQIDGSLQDIKVTYPTGFHDGHLVAQVWVKTNKEESLFAVPVKIHKLGDYKFSSVAFRRN